MSAEFTVLMIIPGIIRSLFISRGAMLKLFVPKWHYFRSDCHLIPSGLVILPKHSLHAFLPADFLEHVDGTMSCWLLNVLNVLFRYPLNAGQKLEILKLTLRIWPKGHICKTLCSATHSSYTDVIAGQ